MSETGAQANEDKAAVAAIRAELGRADEVWTRSRGGKPEPPMPAKVGTRKLAGPRGRVAIIDGARTPFSKANGELRELNVVDLATAPAIEIVMRTGIDPTLIDLSIFGCVIPSLDAPNLGREVVFMASLPMNIPGTTVNLACASANRAITSGAEAILSGQAEVVLAGGAESLSNVPIRFGRGATRRLMELNKAKTLPQRLSVLTKFRPSDLVPVAPAIAEYTTGQSMGESAEKMAKENAISRQAQDGIAYLSHVRAARAHAEGRFAGQLVAVFPPPGYDKVVTTDNGVRADASLAALAALNPVFDRRYGTLTAGNSSPLTDGGAAVLLMSEEKANELGLTPLGFIRSWAYAALDPATQLLQAPAYAAPRALDAAGVSLAEIDLIEMHEAFAAQVMSNMKALVSPRFAHDELGRDQAVGEIDPDRVNVNGGSIALGHPFGATGARVTTQLLRELARRDRNFGLLTVCAAGGSGFAMVVERR